MAKKIKKLKKKKKKKRSKEGGEVMASKAEEGAISSDEHDKLKRQYAALRKRYRELEVAFNRISVLEGDIKKVHEKLDEIDTSSSNVEKELKAVKSKVQMVQGHMKKITIVASNMSKKHGMTRLPRTGARAPATGQRPKGTAAKRTVKKARPGTQGKGSDRPPRPITKAAMALAYSKGVDEGSRAPGPGKRTKVKGTGPGDEISVPASSKGDAPDRKDLKVAADRMDTRDVVTDDDMDSIDYLVTPDGKRKPISKKKVEKEIEESKDED